MATLDEALQRALSTAPPDETLTVIAELDMPEESAAALSPKEFASRVEWREAMIAQREMQQHALVGAVVEHLRKLGVEVSSSGPTAVLRGTPGQLRGASEIEGVRHLFLDKAISLIEPNRPAER